MNRNWRTSQNLSRRVDTSVVRLRALHRLWCALCVVLLLSACSGLGGEPRIVATFPPEARRADAGIPSAQPELARGAAIFAENCTRCHGAAGQGDGELVLSGQLAAVPPDFTDPATTHDQTVTAWFDVITNGRIENLMPPWRDSLSESDRWAVALYTYTMSYQPDQLALGETVWEANCASCHGDMGAGDGARAGEFQTITDLSDPAALLEASDTALSDLLTTGVDGVHDFGSTLDDAERWAVIAFTRTLSLADTEVFDRSVPPPAATAEIEIAAAADISGIVRGQVVNGTQGGAAMTGLNVTLRIFDSALNEELVETAVNEDGSFVIEDVPFSADRAYIATTSYQDRTFRSEMITGGTSAVLELPITVYETTSDPSAISITSLVAQISASANNLQIAQILSFSNTTDRVFSLDETVNGSQHPSVSVPLPEGARILNTADETNRYVLSGDGTTLLDTQPVYPGQEHIVHVIYSLPYEGSRQVELPLAYPLEGAVRLLLEPGSIRVSSEQLPPLGTEAMGNLVVETYGADLSLPAGATLRYEVSGSAAAQTAVSQPNNLLPYILIALGSLSILVSAALYYLGRRTPSLAGGDTRLRQMLVEQIAELDELNQNGQIDAAAYKAQRKKLKARLSSLMKDK